MSSRHVVMRWHLRQVMASRGLFLTSDLVPLLADRGVELSRQYVHKLVTTAPQRINTDLLAALCDILDCTPNDLIEPQVVNEQIRKTVDAPAANPITPRRTLIRRPGQS